MIYTSYSGEQIAALDRIYRLSMINSISGYKSANLIGTKGEDGRENLAIFSSAVHLGSDPALIGLVSRPTTVERHTLANLRRRKLYTVNHVHVGDTAMAHFTSAKWDDDTSEFDACDFISEYVDGYDVPLVKGSPVRMILRLRDELPIEINGTILIIGEVMHLDVMSEALSTDGAIDLSAAGSACISGLNSYYEATPLAKYPYARPHETPVNTLES